MSPPILTYVDAPVDAEQSFITDQAGRVALFASSKDGPAVLGRSVATKGSGFLAGTDPVFHENAGVYGQSDQSGVFGNSDADTGTGVHGRGGGAHGFGVRGETIGGIAVQGRTFSTDP